MPPPPRRVDTPPSSASSPHRPCQTAARWAFGVTLLLYAAAAVALQHKHINEQVADFETTLSRTKDAFLGVTPSEYARYVRGSWGGGDGNVNATIGPMGGFVDGARPQQLKLSDVVRSHRPASAILKNPKLPSWVKEYASWHGAQRRRYLDAHARSDSEGGGTPADDVSDVKFLISRCLASDKCGGASDRLQDMPYNLMLANKTGRVLLVRWEKPAQLENYLVPPVDGIDWTLPDDMYRMLEEDYPNWNLRGKETDMSKKVVSTIRRDSAAPIFRKYENEEVGHKIYHEIFRLLFTPSKALAERVETTMKLLDLVPQHYSSVHLRVKYPMNGIKEQTFTFEKHKSQITQWATNAVNCAAELHPNSTIYVSSDNNDTVGYLLEESHFAQHYIDATRHNKHPLVVKLVARDYSNENEHVAFSTNREADGFMSVFEDMMIMGMGKCVAHGVGGYGRLGAALSGGECAVAHRGRHSRVCSDALAKIQTKIDT